ncbi:hypothetical protein DFH09DRAFT_974069, partial [Mycena vulgaris]
CPPPSPPHHERPESTCRPFVIIVAILVLHLEFLFLCLIACSPRRRGLIAAYHPRTCQTTPTECPSLYASFKTTAQSFVRPAKLDVCESNASKSAGETAA